jgi:hypothetical protein
MRAWLLAILMAGIYALADEWRQSPTGWRQRAFPIVGIDALGIAVSYVLAQHLPSPATFKGMASAKPCPACQGTRVYRSRRRGVLERRARLIRLAPYRCDACNHRFWRFTR